MTAGGDQARRHQFLDGVGAQRAHGVDLLGHFHRAEFAGDAGGVAPRHHERRQHRSQFAHQGERNQRPGLADLPVLRQRARHLQGHHGAAEESGHAHDRQAAHPDRVHLQDDVVAVVGLAEDVPEGPSGEEEEILNRELRALSEDRARRKVPEPRCYHRTISLMMKGLTDIPGIRVGHVSDFEAITGCTAILCEQGAVGGVDIRGSASGTEETRRARSAATSTP